MQRGEDRGLHAFAAVSEVELAGGSSSGQERDRQLSGGRRVTRAYRQDVGDLG